MKRCNAIGEKSKNYVKEHTGATETIMDYYNKSIIAFPLIFDHNP